MRCGINALRRVSAAALAGIAMAIVAHAAGAEAPPAAAPAAPLLQEISVYFAKDDLATPETAKIPANIPLEEKIKTAVERLIAGTDTSERTLPQTAKVLRVFLGDEGDAYIDFSEQLVEHFPGGVARELASTVSICKTVMGNFEVDSVRLLVEGKEIKTLAGHVDLERPISRAACDRLAAWRQEQ